MSQQQPVLTIQDYFKHFESGFKYQPLLFTAGERSHLALSIVSYTKTIDEITQHPAFEAQIRYVKNEFERLRVHKRWDTKDGIYRTNQATFNTALTDTCWKLVQWAKKELTPDLVHFFEKFERLGYTYNFKCPPLVEFNRLCECKKWVKETRDMQHAALRKILDHYDNLYDAPALAAPDLDLKSKRLHDFFKSFRYPEYIYDPDAYPPTEFGRLRKAIRWRSEEVKTKANKDFNALYGTVDCWTFYGRTNLSKSRSTYHSDSLLSGAPKSQETDLSKSPLALFFQSFNGYRYSSRSPTEEFRSLARDLMERTSFHKIAARWKEAIPGTEPCHGEQLQAGLREIKKKKIPGTELLSYWKSEFYRELQDQFYQAIEQQFDWFIDIQCQRTGMEKHEYLVLFFELDDGTQVEGKKFTEEECQKLLSNININIYDFLDHQHELMALENELRSHPASAGTLSSRQVTTVGPAAQHRTINSTPQFPTKFPTVEHLGIYCEITNRVFNMMSAMHDGTLNRLLKHVGRYFGSDARTAYLEKCADVYASTSSLENVDVMMILKIEEFYRNVLSRNVLYQRPQRYWNAQVANEAKVNPTVFRELFNAAHQQQSNDIHVDDRALINNAW